ncbi:MULTISPECIES: sporulation inhibitor of replication protein SirA [Shouchella]|uniref:Sporulation inhibitor of replication protein SirA n=2 Tax=Shouchella TaxID=2893057 RepID=A0ABY7W478_9BACI|nr:MULTISPECIES: sporulation inhibitor of replication protein SirA [Shouchella]MED4127198.1 sporulation inhibitor of replication protein SirA [Shouchella miscanthi]WDF03679.1 sporulation inhibitor of replication protein SirA [Shouchella hunanensis]GAF23515.1 YoxF protein [Bacillus sp. JCM 19047]
MRYYELFNVTEDVASSYLGKEMKLFQLFEEREQARKHTQPIYDRQINYITTSMPEEEIKQIFLSRYKEEDANRFVAASDENPKNHCALMLDAKKICLQAEGDLQAETDVFDLLREVNGFFFAVNVNDRRFGWLKPYEKQSVL